MPVIISSVHLLMQVGKLTFKIRKVGLLALSHNTFKWNKVSNGKFRQSRNSSTKNFSLGIEVAEILTTLSLYNDSTERKINKCRASEKSFREKIL